MATKKRRKGSPKRDPFQVMSIQVMGKKVKINLAAETVIADLDLDMDRIASQMAWIAALWAEAEGEKIRVDAAYRAWRAEFAAKVMKREPKIAEWKVKSRVEAAPTFRKMKEGIALATRNATVLRALHRSLETKASMLQSKGANLRAELNMTNLNIRGKEALESRQEKEGAQKTKLREVLGKKKKKKSRH